MKTNKLLAIVMVMQGLTLASLWVTGPGLATPAMAQVPDSGAQRIEMIRQLEATNAKLDKLVSILESGNLQVKVVSPDTKKEAASGR
jgi:hypothetical protein